MAPLAIARATDDSPGSEQPIRISVLGGLAISGLNAPDATAAVGRGVVRSVLALAASAREGVLRDELTDALWPLQQPQAARNRLHHTLHLARRTLSELAWNDAWIFLEQGRLRLDPRIWCDAWQLEDAARGPLEALPTEVLVETLTLCKGGWAPDVEAAGLGQVIRRNLRDSHIALQRELALRLAADGDTPAFRRALQNVIDLSETDDWAHCQLMQLDLEAGRHHTALRRFESMGKLLALRLGLRPSKTAVEIAALATKRIDQGTSGGSAAEGALPAARSTLIGRESILRTLCAQIAAQPGIWNVTGMTGVGKSTLMREVVRRTAPILQNGAVYVRQEHPAEGMAAAVVRAAGIRDNDQGPSESLTRLLCDREVLLVVDDFDHASNTQDLMALLRLPLKARVVLITGLPLDEGSCQAIPVRVPPLDFAPPDTALSQAQQSAAVALFQARRPSLEDRHLSDTEWREVVALVEELGGLPLAIELAAAQTDTRTPGEILAQVRRGGALTPGVLLHPSGPADAHRRTMQGALDVFVGLLDALDREVYEVVSIFAAPFSAAQVRALCTRIGLPDAARMVDRLPRLARGGLIELPNDSGKYRMPIVPRAHARGMARASGLWARLEWAHVEELIEYLEDRAVGHESPRYAEWLARVRDSEEEALAQMDTARRLGNTQLVRLTVPLVQSMVLGGQGLVILNWCERAVQASVQSSDRDAELRLRTFASMILLAAQRPEEALLHSRVAADLARSETDAGLAALAVATLAQAINATGSIEECLSLLRDWLESRVEPDGAGFWTIFAALGKIRKSGVTPALDALEAIGFSVPPLGVLRARFAGSLLWRQLLVALATLSPDPASRLELGDELVMAGRQMNAVVSIIGGLYFKVNAQQLMGLHDAAGRDLSEWYRLARDSGDAVWACSACLMKVDAAWRTGDLEKAGRWLQEARRHVRVEEPGEQQRMLMLHEVAVAVLRGDKEAAARAFRDALADDAAALHLSRLEGATEVGAMLAGLLGHAELAQSLADALVALSPPAFNPPAVNRFRELHLPAPRTEPPIAGPVPFQDESQHAQRPGREADAASAQARNDIVALLKLLDQSPVDSGRC